MPAGVFAELPSVLPGPMSADLSGAVIPIPLSDGSGLDASVFSTSEGPFPDPRPAALEKTGRIAPGHEAQWFERVHVIPRRRDMGSVLSDQEVEVEIWNAFRALSQELVDVTVEGPAGISVKLPDPAIYPATDSRMYIVHVFAEGDPEINNVVTWVFVGLSGTDLILTGVRLFPWPFPADLSEPLTVTREFLTKVLEAYDGSEQRQQLRSIPVGAIEYSVYLRRAREAQLANALVYGRQAQAFGVPQWNYANRLLSAIAIDSTTILVETDNVPFLEGGLAFIFRDVFTWEVVTIETVAAGSLTTALGMQKEWTPPGVLVMPMVIGRMSQEEAMRWLALRSGSKRTRFDIDGFTQ